jgi:hypothetical protein
MTPYACTDDIDGFVIQLGLLNHTGNLRNQNRPCEKHGDDRRNQLLAEYTDRRADGDAASATLQIDVQRGFHAKNSFKHASLADANESAASALLNVNKKPFGAEMVLNIARYRSEILKRCGYKRSRLKYAHCHSSF